MMTPKAMLTYLEKQGRALATPPDLGIIFVHQKFLLKDPVLSERLKKQGHFFPPVFFVDTPEGSIGLCVEFGVGAPALGLAMELFIELGVKDFIAIGSAGALHEKPQTGDTYLVESAFVEEGLSLHYNGQRGAEVFAPGDLLREFKDFYKGQKPSETFVFLNTKTLTTDAPYRVLKSEREQYVERGASLVDMESSAFYSLAQFHKVNALALLTVSDRQQQEVWSPEFHFKSHRNAQQRALSAALSFLSKKKTPG